MYEDMDFDEHMLRLGAGDRDIILADLKSWNYVYNENAIEAAIQYRLADEEIGEAMRALCNEHTSVSCGVSIAMMAQAGCAILGFKPYTGDHTWIKNAIKERTVLGVSGC